MPVLQADLLEKLTETKYLSETNYVSYRAIMRLFYLEHQKMHYQLDKDTVLQLLRDHPMFAEYTAAQLTVDLDQLTAWKNLTTVQDPHRHYTIADFKNRRFQYMMSPAAVEIERMTVTLEHLSVSSASLSPSSFRRLQDGLRRLDKLKDMELIEVQSWWRDIQGDFQRLSQNYQDYLREFYGPGMEKRMNAEEFVIYKHHLIHYLEGYIQDLQHSAAQIGAQLDACSPEQIAEMLDLVARSELEVVPHPRSAQPSWQEVRSRCEGVWQALTTWFTGQEPTSRQVLDVTNKVISDVVQNAALLVQLENIGVSNKAGLHHLLTLFASCPSLPEAHRLSAMAFGAQQARHYSVNADQEPDRIDRSTYDEPPLTYTVQPRLRTYKPRIERKGFADKSEEKARQREKLLAEEQALKQQVLHYIRDGQLDFALVRDPIPPSVRTVLLSWVASANLDPEQRGHTEYGQSYRLHGRGKECRVPCTDGTLTMPDCVLIFEEGGHV